VTFKLEQSIQPEQMKALMEFTMLDDQITTKHTLPLWNDVKELGTIWKTLPSTTHGFSITMVDIYN
jgi:hypothetical protein